MAVDRQLDVALRALLKEYRQIGYLLCLNSLLYENIRF